MGQDQPWAAAVFPGTPRHPPACHPSRPKLWVWGQGPGLVPSTGTAWTLQGLCLSDEVTGLRAQDVSPEGRVATGRDGPGSRMRARFKNSNWRPSAGSGPAEVPGRPLSEPRLGPNRTGGVGVCVAINRLLLRKMDSF